MIPYDMDPSLYTSEPEPPVLDDGFSPPRRDDPLDAQQAPFDRDDPEPGATSRF